MKYSQLFVVIFPYLFLIGVAVDERGQNRAMEGKGVLVREGLDRGLMCDDDDREERVFKVGELVEYWAGAMVRSGRGKYRQVEWRQMYKDGSFIQ